MWHEARKQERRIRGMIVDYRKRAERRQDFYEKIQADPTQFIQVHGRRCRILLDPAVAAAGDGAAIIVPWQGQMDNMIDRFDVRAHLDYIPPIVKKDEGSEEPPLSQEERQCNYERYRILAQNDFLRVTEERFLHQLYLEEQFGANAQLDAERNMAKSKKSQKSGATIGYSYDEAEPGGGYGPQPFSQIVPSSGGAQASGSGGGAGAKSEKDSDSDSESDMDMDVALDITKLETSQAHELNGFGRNYGMLENDFYSYLTKDADEADAMRIAREEEQEKMLLSGRKSRRERRAQKERRIACRPFSPPSYAAKEDDASGAADKQEEDSDSHSPSPDTSAGKITYITYFGGEDELQPHSKISINLVKGPQSLGESCVGVVAGATTGTGYVTYAQKVKDNLDKLRMQNESAKRSRRHSRSHSRTRRRSSSNRRHGYSRSRTRSHERRRLKDRRSRSHSGSYERSKRKKRQRHSRSRSRDGGGVGHSSAGTASRHSRRRRYTSSSSRSRSSRSSHSCSRTSSTCSRSSRSNHRWHRKHSTHRRRSRSASSKRRRRTISPSTSPRGSPVRSTAKITSAAASISTKTTRSGISATKNDPIITASAQFLTQQQPPPPPMPIQTVQPQVTATVTPQVVEAPPPPLKRYYGRKRGSDSDSSSKSSDSEESEVRTSKKSPFRAAIAEKNDNDDSDERPPDGDSTSQHSPHNLPGMAMTSKATGKQTGKDFSTAPAKNTSFPSNATDAKASSSTGGGGSLNLRERLKRKMQNLLNKQYKADKRAEIEKTERERQMQQEREDEMRELALKLRRRQRELRHRYGTPSSGKASDSDVNDRDKFISSRRSRSESSRRSESYKAAMTVQKVPPVGREHSEEMMSHHHRRRQVSIGRSISRERERARTPPAHRRSRSRSRNRRSASRRRRRSTSRYASRHARGGGEDRDLGSGSRYVGERYARHHDERYRRSKSHDRGSGSCRERDRYRGNIGRDHRGGGWHDRERDRNRTGGREWQQDTMASTSSRNRVVISAPPKLKKLVDY